MINLSIAEQPDGSATVSLGDRLLYRQSTRRSSVSCWRAQVAVDVMQVREDAALGVHVLATLRDGRVYLADAPRCRFVSRKPPWIGRTRRFSAQGREMRFKRVGQKHAWHVRLLLSGAALLIPQLFAQDAQEPLAIFHRDRIEIFPENIQNNRDALWEDQLGPTRVLDMAMVARAVILSRRIRALASAAFKGQDAGPSRTARISSDVSEW